MAGGAFSSEETVGEGEGVAGATGSDAPAEALPVGSAEGRAGAEAAGGGAAAEPDAVGTGPEASGASEAGLLFTASTTGMATTASAEPTMARTMGRFLRQARSSPGALPYAPRSLNMCDCSAESSLTMRLSALRSTGSVSRSFGFSRSSP